MNYDSDKRVHSSRGLEATGSRNNFWMSVLFIVSYVQTWLSQNLLPFQLIEYKKLNYNNDLNDRLSMRNHAKKILDQKNEFIEVSFLCKKVE